MHPSSTFAEIVYHRPDPKTKEVNICRWPWTVSDTEENPKRITVIIINIVRVHMSTSI